MKFVRRIVGKMNKKVIAITIMGAAVGALLLAMSVGLIWPIPFSIGLLEEIHAILIGTELLQKISRL
jgi:hypothetical protein